MVEEPLDIAGATVHEAHQELATTTRAVLQFATDVVHFAYLTATFAVRLTLIERRLHDTHPLVLLSVNDYVVVQALLLPHLSLTITAGYYWSLLHCYFSYSSHVV
jgi:uncharacterized membrane protein YhaH (DUF805 family)